jgi:phenylacetate-coenzyme A ligase PaaK-like adenylate-forming protein
MSGYEYFRQQIFSPALREQFEELAIGIFRWQAAHNPVYKQFIHGVKIDPDRVERIEDIPFLPIELFKTNVILTGDAQLQTPNSELRTPIFTSSGTTGTQSKHYVTDISLYEESYRKGFAHFYGNIKDHTLLALLPSYLEREGSSLIYMVDDLVKQAADGSGFFLRNRKELSGKLETLKPGKRKVILLGVTYALLDLAEEFPMQLGDAIIMETGGMKGQRREMIREEVHEILCKSFGVNVIHSEYGMTELLSQAYSKGNGIFSCPPWMRILTRDTGDPLSMTAPGKTGGINVIDLANLNSCCFIATQDLGRLHGDNTFEVLGRFDNSDVRGCNLMIG